MVGGYHGRGPVSISLAGGLYVQLVTLALLELYANAVFGHIAFTLLKHGRGQVLQNL